MNIRQRKTIFFILRQIRDIFLIYFFTVFVTYVMIGNVLLTSFKSMFLNSIYGFFLGFPLWKGNQFIGWIITYYYPWRKKPEVTLRKVLLSSFLFSLFTIIAANYLVLYFIYDINLFENIRKFTPQMFMVLVLAMLITITYYVINFFKWWRISVVNEAKLQQETIQLRYDALKSQVNPHFLFNSLSVLSSLIDTDTQRAKLFIQQFSNIYRYVLEHRESELVPLNEEINFIKSFTNLHLLRHGESLQVSIDVDDTSGYIIPLSLQILLENCFKHNIISEEKPLIVKVWREDDYVLVQNNLQKRKTIHDSGGVGLETICKRYEYLSDRKVEIIMSNEFYTVKIPIL